MSPERQAAAAVDRAATVDDVRLPITGTEAVEAISGAGLVIVPAERMVAHPAPDLDALVEAARAATPGPWEVERDIDPAHYSPDVLAAGGVIVQTLASDMTRTEDAANAAYIAALHPGAALALIARVRRAEAALLAIRTSWGGYAVRNHAAALELIESMFAEIRRMDGIARAALEARTDGE